MLTIFHRPVLLEETSDVAGGVFGASEKTAALSDRFLLGTSRAAETRLTSGRAAGLGVRDPYALTTSGLYVDRSTLLAPLSRGGSAYGSRAGSLLNDRALMILKSRLPKATLELPDPHSAIGVTGILTETTTLGREVTAPKEIATFRPIDVHGASSIFKLRARGSRERRNGDDGAGESRNVRTERRQFLIKASVCTCGL